MWYFLICFYFTFACTFNRFVLVISAFILTVESNSFSTERIQCSISTGYKRKKIVDTNWVIIKESANNIKMCEVFLQIIKSSTIKFLTKSVVYFSTGDIFYLSDWNKNLKILWKAKKLLTLLMKNMILLKALSVRFI